MVSLYGRYIKEREGKDILEYDDAFGSYEIGDDYIYLVDVYVIPENRRKKRFGEIESEVANIGKENGCKWILATVDPEAKNSDISNKVLLSYGYKFWKESSYLDWYKKEL